VSASSANLDADSVTKPDPPTPLQLSAFPKLLTLLLADARQRFAEERERHAQVFTRSGFYLAVMGAYMSVLIRIVDKPPAIKPAWMYWTLAGLGGLLLLLICASAALVLWAVLGRYVGLAIAPTTWLRHVEDKLKPSFDKDGIAGPELDAGLDALAQEQMLLTLAEAVDNNRENNDARFNKLYRVSRILLGSLLVLVAATVFYAMLPAAVGKAPGEPACKVESVR